MTDRPNGLTYAQAGVDIDAGNALVEAIKPLARATARPGMAGGLGGFGARQLGCGERDLHVRRRGRARLPDRHLRLAGGLPELP